MFFSSGGRDDRGRGGPGGQNDGRKKSSQRMDPDGWSTTPVKAAPSKPTQAYDASMNPFLQRSSGPTNPFGKKVKLILPFRSFLLTYIQWHFLWFYIPYVLAVLSSQTFSCAYTETNKKCLLLAEVNSKLSFHCVCLPCQTQTLFSCVLRSHQS